MDGRLSGRLSLLRGLQGPSFCYGLRMTVKPNGLESRWYRICVFVDGENFRFSLASLFSDDSYGFTVQDYLPNTNWHDFFQSMCGRPGWDLSRVYWYVTREIDFWPYRIPHDWQEKRNFLERNRIIARLNEQGFDFSNGREGLRQAEGELRNRRQTIQRRADGWHKIQAAIERQYDQIQFQRVGSIRYDLVQRSFGNEKGVDTQLATDMIALSNNYDVALLVSGDADYIPPVSAVKNLGKLVYSVSFLTADGTKLPGGAWRLERSVDGQIELPFEQVSERLGIST